MPRSDAPALARALLDLCRMRKWTIATAESCTGGLVAAALSDIPGSSDVLDRGYVTYSNESKRAMLGVTAATLLTFGAVSRETAMAMAIGALEKSGADLTIAITGIAGPGGATEGKPVGMVHFAAAARDGRIVHRECRFGALGRTNVRARSVIEALKILTELMREPRKPRGTSVKRSKQAAHKPHARAPRTPRRTAGTRRPTSRPSPSPKRDS